MSQEIYHEKQSFMFCAIHAINNLFQKKLFTKAQFDEICKLLSPDYYINPHKSVLGIGNYDVNCIMKALESQEKELIWYDKRREITAESIEINNNSLFGYILNAPSDYTFGFISIPIKSRHWITFRKGNDDNFYNLDSKLDRPKLIGSSEDFIIYLKNEMITNDKELFIVISKN
ncbi:hypothetical protein PVAND_001695 [Polypedilum vanderplanki]|uniref:ubiquitinyl hydrolase 1 n=1 Tax=Polypedilum vanderplanki TaxID=319348 RepID=A0A9J6BP69_POLVA|nr:hypothetical protein PVAND_001695 [Polypedilum vanderplanki]